MRNKKEVFSDKPQIFRTMLSVIAALLVYEAGKAAGLMLAGLFVWQWRKYRRHGCGNGNRRPDRRHGKPAHDTDRRPGLSGGLEILPEFPAREKA